MADDPIGGSTSEFVSGASVVRLQNASPPTFLSDYHETWYT